MNASTVVTLVCCLGIHYAATLASNKPPKITTTRALRKVRKATEARATGNLLSVSAFWMRKYLYNPEDINGTSANPIVGLHEGQRPPTYLTPI